MPQRFRIYSADTLTELIDALNAHPDYCGRIVFMERTEETYRAVLDEWALITEDIRNIEQDEDIREYNQNVLQMLDLPTSHTL